MFKGGPVMRRALWFVVSVAMGCGSEPTPVEKCDDLVDALCDRGVACVPNSGTHTTCVQELRNILPCGSAKSVSASYDRCLDQIETNSCSVLFPINPMTGEQTVRLPADCMQVILTRQPPASGDGPTFDGAEQLGGLATSFGADDPR
jgi:hypothetical protein